MHVGYGPPGCPLDVPQGCEALGPAFIVLMPALQEKARKRRSVNELLTARARY